MKACAKEKRDGRLCAPESLLLHVGHIIMPDADTYLRWLAISRSGYLRNRPGDMADFRLICQSVGGSGSSPSRRRDPCPGGGEGAACGGAVRLLTHARRVACDRGLSSSAGAP